MLGMRYTYLTLREIRPSLGNPSFSTLRKWIHAGRLPGYYAGGRIVVRENDLLEFIKPVQVGKKGGAE